MLEIAWNAKKTWNIEKNKLYFIFFNILKIHKKLKQHSINIKNYTAHPHDMVHIPAKFRENTSMLFWVTVRKLNVTDRQTDRQTDGRGPLQYLPSRSFGSARGKKKKSYWSVSEILRDGRTDRRTTDELVLEKLRCLSAGGANKKQTI